MDSFLLLRRLVAAIVFKGQTVSDYWWSRRTIFLTDKASTWYLNGSPMVVTLGQQYNVGEKPTIILYTYINRHAEPPSITKQKTL